MSDQKKSVIIVLLVVLGALLGYRFYVTHQRQLAERVSENRLKEIGLAFHWYETGAKNPLLPAYSLDSKGNPGLSWRVLLLPHLGEDELFNKFRLDEPWDSPTNIQLVDQIPQLYRSQFCVTNDRGFTSFIVVVDSDSAFPPVIDGQTLHFSDVTDGRSKTLLAIELPEASQIWTKPDSLSIQEVSSVWKNRKSGQRLIMAFCDGSVCKFESYVGDETFRAFCSRSGNEDIYPETVSGFLRF